MSEESSQSSADGATERVRAFANQFVSSQIDQMETMFEQAEKLQAEGIERSKKHLEQAVELGEETLDYMQTLGREWREMQIETLKNVAGRNDE